MNLDRLRAAIARLEQAVYDDAMTGEYSTSRAEEEAAEEDLRNARAAVERELRAIEGEDE